MHKVKKDLVVFGAGGCGREVIWQLSHLGCKEQEYNILGFIDDTPNKRGIIVDGYPVLGGTEWLCNYDQPICVLICLGESKNRKKVYEKLKKNHNIEFPTVFLGNVIASPFVKIGEGGIVCMDTKITVDVTIGDFFYAGIGCCISHDDILGDFVTLYPGVNLSGNVYVGDYVEIGTGAKIIPKKSVGDNTIIGAGAVVVSDLPENAVAVGVPAKVIKEREK